MAGEGSIFQLPNGKWVAQLSSGGRTSRSYRKRIRHTRAAAREALEELRADRRAGVKPSRQTLSDYLNRWVADVRNIRPATRRSYAVAITHHLVPLSGDIRLRELTPLHVEHLLGQLAERLGPKSARNTHAVLRRALSQAVRAGVLTRNVASRQFVDAPRVSLEEPRALSRDEVRRLLTALKDDPIEALVVTAVGTGLRQGELLGLAWEDLDLGSTNQRGSPDFEGSRGEGERNDGSLSRGIADVQQGAGGLTEQVLGGRVSQARLTVRRELVRRAGRYFREEPKTPRSRRVVPLPDAVRAALVAHRERLIAAGFVPTSTGPVFAARNGGPLNGSWVTHHLQQILEAAQLPPIGFRNLRTTYASRLFEAGVPSRTISDLLGHSREHVTQQHYVESGSGQQAAIEAAQRLIG